MPIGPARQPAARSVQPRDQCDQTDIGGYFFGSCDTMGYSWTLGVGGGWVWVQKNRDQILRKNKKIGIGRAAADFFGFGVQNMIQNAFWEASGGVN